MKMIIRTESFLKILIPCIAFVSISMFAIEFEEPVLYPTELEGKNLKLVKSIKEEDDIKLDDVKQIMPKLTANQAGWVYWLASAQLLGDAKERNEYSVEIDEYKNKRKELLAQFIKQQPTYKNDKQPIHATLMLFIDINDLKDDIESNREDRVEIDQHIIETINKLNEYFNKETNYSEDNWRQLFK